MNVRVILMDEEAELEQIRRKKLEDLQMQASHQEVMAEHQKQMEAQRQIILRKILTPKARERLGRLRTARPELVASIEDQLIALATAGRVSGQISDEELRRLLGRLMPKKRDIKIERR